MPTSILERPWVTQIINRLPVIELEEWIMVSLAHHLPVPPIDGIELAVREVA
jgi:hypothetical protein